MPSNLTDVDAFTSPVSVPNDAEFATQASLLLFAQGLANRTRWLLNRSINALTGGSYAPAAPISIAGAGLATSNLDATSVNVTTSLVMPPEGLTTFAAVGASRIQKTQAYHYTSSAWIMTQMGSGALRLVQNNVAGGGLVAYRLIVPRGVTITNVAISVKGGSGHAASLPVTLTMPRIRLGIISPFADSAVFGADVIDASTTNTAYEAAHFIQISGANLPVGLNPATPQSYNYDLQVEGEYGTGSQTGLTLLGVLVQFTQSAIDYAGS